MYRVVLRVERVPGEMGPQAAADITEGFTHRPWHQKVTCIYEEGGLTFVSENDFDENGLATQDEFSDEFSANVPSYQEENGDLTLVKVEDF